MDTEAESVTIPSGTEYSTDGGETWTAADDGAQAIEPGQEILVREAAADDYSVPGDPATATAPEKADTPTGLSPTNETAADAGDGKVTGLDPETAYEYSTDGGETWTSVPEGSTEITGLSDGEVQVRATATDDAFASDPVTLTIGAGSSESAEEPIPMYRLYNPNSGEHHYTTSRAEVDVLVQAGWNYEGIGWYSDDDQGVALYRVYNPNEWNNNHHYTASIEERDNLIGLGWQDEGIAWYGVKVG